MITKQSASLYKRKQSVAYRVSRYMLVAGVAATLLGLFIYLLGNVRIGPIRWFYQSIIQNQGIARLLGSSPAALSQSFLNFSNNAVFITIAGLVLAGNAFLLRTQPWERFKDALFVQPALVLLLLFSYYPLVELARLSFTDANLVDKEYSFIGFDQYNWLLYRSGPPYFIQALMVTGWFILWETLATVLGGLLLALLFAGPQRSRRVARALLSVPRFVIITGSAIVFIWMLSTPFGVANYLLSLIRLPGIAWRHDTSASFSTVYFLSIWRCLGFGMMIYASSIQSIPADYYEAARIEGADKMRCFRSVTLPLLKQTIFYLISISVLSSMKVYETYDVLKAGQLDAGPKIFPHFIYGVAFEDYYIGRASAVSVMYFLILFVFTLATVHFTFRPTEE